MPSLRIEILGGDASDVWDRFVLSHDQGTPFHTTEWLRNFGDHLRTMVAVDGLGRVKAGIALVKTTKLGISAYFTLPYTPYGGPLVSISAKERRAAARSEVQSVLALLLDHLPPAPHHDFILPPGGHEYFPFVLAGFTPSLRLTHELLPGDDYETQAGPRQMTYLRKLRRKVLEGELRISLDAEFESVLELAEETARRRGFRGNVPLLSRLVRSGGGAYRWRSALVKSREGQALAASLVLTDQRRAFNLVNCCQTALPKGLEQVSLLALDSTVRVALEGGLVFDFEGSMLPGVERFYRRFGGIPRALVRLQRSRSLLISGARAFHQIRHERSRRGPQPR